MGMNGAADLTQDARRIRRTARATLVSFIAAVLFQIGSAHAELLHFDVDTAKTTIIATVDEPLSPLNGSTDGSFRLISGEVDGDPAKPAATGHVKLVIDATSYSSGLDHRDRKVLSSALETALYQSIIFESKRIDNAEIDAPGALGKATIVGSLTLHGTTRELDVPVSVTLSPDRHFSADGEVSFDYTDYGVHRPGVLGVIKAGRRVSIRFHVVAAPPIAPATVSTQ
jgi:polyisoprenoid-binding protein YceI